MASETNELGVKSSLAVGSNQPAQPLRGIFTATNSNDVAPTVDVNSADSPAFTNHDYHARTIMLQSLLLQFNVVKVRADFANGKFGPQVEPHWLQLIDDLRCTLMPRWVFTWFCSCAVVLNVLEQ